MRECKSGDKLSGARHRHLSDPSGEFFQILPVNIFGSPILYIDLTRFMKHANLKTLIRGLPYKKARVTYHFHRLLVR